MNKTLKILLLSSDKIKEWWMKNNEYFERYFNMEVIYDDPKNIKKYLNTNVDILFLDDSKTFNIGFYPIFRNSNPLFSYIVFSKKMSDDDINIYKKDFADRIIYTECSDLRLRWAIISSLRRYWNSYSKPTTIIYKGIIADFIDDKFIIDKNEVTLTPKEIKILRLLLENRKKFINKKTIFNKVWGHNDEDSTRTVDQTLFKLRKKIGDEYFEVQRNKGVKFE